MWWGRGCFRYFNRYRRIMWAWTELDYYLRNIEFEGCKNRMISTFLRRVMMKLRCGIVVLVDLDVCVWYWGLGVIWVSRFWGRVPFWNWIWIGFGIEFDFGVELEFEESWILPSSVHRILAKTQKGHARKISMEGIRVKLPELVHSISTFVCSTWTGYLHFHPRYFICGVVE